MTYKEILCLTMQSTLNFCKLVLIILFVLVILVVLQRVVGKRKVTGKQLGGFVVIAAALLLLLGWKVVPATLDISEEDYVIIEGTVNKFSGTGAPGNGLYNGAIYIVTDDGDTVQVQLSPGMSKAFPNGEFQATIVYAKRSCYLFDIFPDRSIEEAIASSEQLQQVVDTLTYDR